MKNVVVFGASSGGKLVGDALTRQPKKYNLVCFVDNDPELKGKKIFHKPVLGDLGVLPSVLAENNIHEVIVAISNVDDELILEISNLCQEKNVDIRVIPKALDIFLEDPILNQLKNVDVSDLLGRKEIVLDSEFLLEQIVSKSLIVTGAAGSIGSELVRQVARFNPSKIIAIDLNENELYLLELFIKRHYSEIDFHSVIGSVQDESFIRHVFKDNPADIVFHCAAHKHVPLMERYPQQAVKNNVYGTYVVARATQEFSVKRFVLISTDKAVNPTNCMGASKRLAELISLSMNSLNTKFMAVRFGNVLGSAGSVIPIFRQLLREGKNLTVTDERMTRYFMTIPEAARLVIEAGYRGEGGELFVLDMGEPVKITDLAKNMIKLSGAAANIEYVGLRPGEKLYEELFYDHSLVDRTKNEKIMISRSESEEKLEFANVIDSLVEVLEGRICPRQFLRDYVPSAEI
ncbi:polysaccharide biosynthesis protein [Corallincola luteus]|uniref:Polysaccharide biosynthesis protein n=1 Tax=Corallincola luteus TaxID=1775177 RepID=A0ABY2AQE2_9GAMM|nr:nucleoside-diphosphate sugar epimerase/dehydratase [Corallincola luteus]TCI05418.1 polysaccharide biosynthesis protein [Corallincola luteus]